MNSRSAKTVGKIIDDFLKRHNLFVEDPPWCLQNSPLGGLGVFATRNLDVGEEIFKDFPVILGSRTTQDVIFCVVCYKKDTVKSCPKNCGLPICSTLCEQHHEPQCKLIRSRSQATSIGTELLKISAPLNSLLLNDEDKKVVVNLKLHKAPIHGIEIDRLKNLGFVFEKSEENYLRLVCAVMDANAFETIVTNDLNLRGLYPLAGLVNHSCVPNLMHVFNEHQQMVVRTTIPVKKGEELYHSYARLIWSTSTRRFHLYKTKHFLCRCARCSDPTEFGAYTSAFLCNCGGNVISKNSLKLNSHWFCENCNKNVDRKEIASKMSIIGSILNTIEADNLDVILKFLNGRLSKMVSENNETILELKYKTVWIIGYNPKYKLKEIDGNLLEFKTKTCAELLKIIEILRLGECKLKGLLLFELYLCLKEKLRRNEELVIKNNSKRKNDELLDVLKQAACIFKDDVGAPEAIKDLNRQ